MKLTKEFLTKLIKEELEKTTLSEARFAVYSGTPSPSKRPIGIFPSEKDANDYKEYLLANKPPYSTSTKFSTKSHPFYLNVAQYTEKSAQPDAAPSGDWWAWMGTRWENFGDDSYAAQMATDSKVRNFPKGYKPTEQDFRNS